MKNKAIYNSNKRNGMGLPQRRSIRLKGYNYAQAGLYFVTICCDGKQHRFGEIAVTVGAGFTPAQNDNVENKNPHNENSQQQNNTEPAQVIATNTKMILNEYGKIAYNEWIKLPKRFPNFKLDVFQIMPNHMHGIIVLNESVVDRFTPDKNDVIAQNVIIPQNDVGIMVTVGTTAISDTEGTTARVAATVSDIVGAYKSLVANGCLNIYKSKNETMGKLWQRNYYEHIIRNEKSYQSISKYIINNPEKWAEDKFYVK